MVSGVLGWIVICAILPVFPGPPLPHPVFGTRAACIEANLRGMATAAALRAAVGDRTEIHDQCWCEPVEPAH